MKKFLLVLAGGLMVGYGMGQTLFTYGDHTVSKQEFLTAFNRNKTAAENNKKALGEYLNLYVNFKLKVQAAKDEKFDTLASQKNDLQNFRNQLEPGYLFDSTALSKLIKEALLRRLSTLHLTYYYIPFNGTDTVQAMGYAQSIYQKLKPLISLQKQSEDDKTLLEWASYYDAGKITVFSLPYSIENVVYELPTGVASKPNKGKDGYYIFQVENKGRASVDKIKTAQILIAVPAGATQAEEEQFNKKADSLYLLLKKDSSFRSIAQQYSDDRSTADQGGEMNEYGHGTYSKEFDEVAFALKNQGDISKPFRTAYGYHILKLLQKSPVITNEPDESNQSLIKQRVIEDARIHIARDKFVEHAKVVERYTKNNLVNYALLKSYTDSFVLVNKQLSSKDLSSKTVLFSLNHKNYNVSDWYTFINTYRGAMNETVLPSFDKLMKLFIDNQVTDYYRSHLEDYSSSFKQQLNEYREGNLLFDIMEKKVWGRASIDTSELEQFYKNNLSKYIWGKSVNAVVVSCKDKEVASKVKRVLEDGESNTTIKNLYSSAIIDSGRFELKQLAINNHFVLKDNYNQNEIQVVENNDPEGSYSVIKILSSYPEGERKSFQEARGLVVGDYQQYLEEAWMNSLKKKYPVHINTAVLNSIVL